MKRYSFLLLMIITLLSSCKGGKNDAEIIILTTNDIHGRIDNFSKIAAYYKKMKAEHKHVFLFNAGDMFSGNPLVDQYPEKGYPIIDIMNKVGYQLSTFGNHEFDYGQEVLSVRLKQAKFPFILANAVPDSLSPLPQFNPYYTFNINNLKMTVVSVIETSSDGLPSTHPDKLKNIAFYDPVKTILKYRNLRNDCNVFIGLTHTGVQTDIKIAEQMPELDVILGGHSHTRIDTGMVVNNVLITQSESTLKYLGQTTIIVKGGKVVSKSNKLIDLSKLNDKDEEVYKLIEEYKAKDPGSIVIGKTENNIAGKQALGALMTDAITEGLGMDIAFQNAGGIRIDKLNAGDITINDIYMLDPFGNEVIKVIMTGEEIKELLTSTMHKTKAQYPDLLLSGISYEAKIKPNGEVISINIKDKKGQPLDLKKKYAVGMNSYIYSRYNFKHDSDPGTSLKTTSADALINYIKQKKTINEYNNTHRIKIEVQN